MATDDLSANANTIVMYEDAPFTVAYEGSSATAQKLMYVFVQVTADDAGDYVDLNDHLPGGNVTILADLGRTGATAMDATYVTWSSDRVTFANNAGSSEINRVLLLVSVA